MYAPASRSTRSTGRQSARAVTVDPRFDQTFMPCDDAQAPPEILRFRSRGLSGDYYQALGTAAAMRLRLLGTLHARSELAGPSAREAARERLLAQQRQAWQQLQWLMAEMRRLDAELMP